MAAAQIVCFAACARSIPWLMIDARLQGGCAAASDDRELHNFPVEVVKIGS